MSHKMFDVLSELDGLCSELEDVKNLLTLCEESISKDLEPLYRGESWGDKYILSRAPLHESMFSTIRHRLNDICEDMQKSVSEGYECHKDSRSVQVQ